MWYARYVRAECHNFHRGACPINCAFHPASKSKLTPLPPQTSTTMAPFSSPCNSSSNFERSLSEYSGANDAPQAGSTNIRCSAANLTHASTASASVQT
mmetsp:Transcript_17509/g.37848  ORF Transcript_17509/g.37848 Transcript_17509/m.37848 type:complete len:98 (+) Transcript_17509:345-638(+)